MAPRLDRLGEQIDVRAARGGERAVERLHAVLPNADVDRLGFCGHLGAQLRASPFGQELHPQRRPGWHLGDHGADHDLDPGAVSPLEECPHAAPGFGPGAGDRAPGNPGPAGPLQGSGDAEVQARGEPGDVVDRLDDVRAGLRVRPAVGPVGDRDAAHRAEVRQELGAVEHGGDGLPPACLAHQREVRHGERATPERGNRAESIQAVALPAGPVHHQAIGHPDQVAGEQRVERRLARPPDRHRKVVNEQGCHDRPKVASRRAAGRGVDLLGAGRRRVGAGDHAIRLDLRPQPARAVRVSWHEDERPRRVAAGQHGDRRGGALAELRAPGNHHQVEHAGPGGDVAFDGTVHRCPRLRERPEPRQLALDPRDRRRLAGPEEGRVAGRGHGRGRGAGHARPAARPVQMRRHRRPSRSSISSDAAGPQLPAA